MSIADLSSFFFSYASRIVCFPGIQTPFVCNLAGPHQGPSNCVTFEDCNSSVEDNLLGTPHESSIFLSSPYGAEATITKEMTRDFSNFTRTSFEPPENIEVRYISSLNNTLYSNSAIQNYMFFKIRLEPLKGRCQPLQLIALFGRSCTRYGHSWTSTEKMNFNQSSLPMLTSSSNLQDTASAYGIKGFKFPDTCYRNSMEMLSTGTIVLNCSKCLLEKILVLVMRRKLLIFKHYVQAAQKA